jgi:hypothetical protein
MKKIVFLTVVIMLSANAANAQDETAVPVLAPQDLTTEIPAETPALAPNQNAFIDLKTKEIVPIKRNFASFGFSVSDAYVDNGFYGDMRIGKGKWGIGMTLGTTYTLAQSDNGNIKLGLDVAWLDLNVSSINFLNYGTMYQSHVGMGLGFSVNFYFTRSWGIRFYTRYNPSFSIFENAAEKPYIITGGYSSVFVSGVSFILNGGISIGFEARYSLGSYHGLNRNSYGHWTEEHKFKTKGSRIFVGFPL